MSNKHIGTHKPSVSLSHITETDAILEIHHQDNVAFITAFVPVDHYQMAKIATAWLNELPKDEQRVFIAQLQQIVD